MYDFKDYISNFIYKSYKKNARIIVVHYFYK